MIFARVEGSVLFAAVCGTIFWLGHPLLLDWTDVATVVGQRAALSAGCIVAFHYHDLYARRFVRRSARFAARLVQAFGMVLVLLAAFYFHFPATLVTAGPALARLAVISVLLQPGRAFGYAAM